ncbi:MAG: hypothetical protein JSV22_08440 [Bacteroidales bacterium]|nr:MAG: hypothetical protein JSV22_08440 [Bacteroidales bacterium]
MNVSELKLRIFRKLDSLEKSKLEELYGIVVNFLNGHRDIDDWNELSEIQKKGLLDAIDEIDSGKGIPHKQIIAKYRKKYSDA